MLCEDCFYVAERSEQKPELTTKLGTTRETLQEYRLLQHVLECIITFLKSIEISFFHIRMQITYPSQNVPPHTTVVDENDDKE